jgi:tetratricopeptide (TPR) repeat protein
LTRRSKGDKEKAIHHFKAALGIASPFNWHGELFWNQYNLADVFCDENEFCDVNTHCIGQAKSHIAYLTYKLGLGMKMQAKVWYRQHRLEEAKAEALHALENYEKLGLAGDAGVCRDLLEKIE